MRKRESAPLGCRETLSDHPGNNPQDQKNNAQKSDNPDGSTPCLLENKFLFLVPSRRIDKRECDEQG